MSALMRPGNDLLLMADDDNLEQYLCTYDGCGRTYKHKRNLQIHVKTDHAEPEDQTLHECGHDGCTRTFKYKCALNRHILLTHSGDDVRESALAKRRKAGSGRLPASQRSERKFIVLTGEVPGESESKLYQCAFDGCTRVFTSKGSLSLHQERKHVNPNAFVCPIENCGRIFSYRHVMHTHVERVHHMEVDDPSVKRRRRSNKEGGESFGAEDHAMIDASMINKVNASNFLPAYLGADVPESDSEDEAATMVKNLSNMGKATAVSKKTPGTGAGSSSSTSTRGAAAAGVGIHALAALSAAVQDDAAVYNASLASGGGEGLFHCTVPGCNKTFPLKHVYQAHMRRVHNVDEK